MYDHTHLDTKSPAAYKDVKLKNFTQAQKEKENDITVDRTLSHHEISHLEGLLRNEYASKNKNNKDIVLIDEESQE